jgi:multidrug resistance efflux pump
LATLVPSGKLQVIAAFDPATALGRLAPGQSARMRLDGRDWATFGDLAGAVARVGAEPGEQALRVELQLAPSSGQRLMPHHGMTGAVEVAVERVSPATLVLRAIGRALS